MCSRAAPMFTRRFMPPEYLSTRSFCRSTRPISSSTSSTRLVRTEPLNPYIRPQNMRFSRPLRSSYRAMSCGTTPMSFLTSSALRITENPPTSASPESGLSRQERMEMVVVLPAPLGPRRLKISPSWMVKETPSTATGPLGGSNCLRSLSTTIASTPFPPRLACDASNTSGFAALRIRPRGQSRTWPSGRHA